MVLVLNEDPCLMVESVHYQMVYQRVFVDFVIVFLFSEMEVLIYEMNVSLNTYFFPYKMVGLARFELTTSRPPDERATRLRYSP